MDQPKPWPSAIQSLRRAANAAEQKDAIRSCSELAITRPGILTEYLDALLFTMAFPFTKSNYRLAHEEKSRLHHFLKLRGINTHWQGALEGSGLPNTIHRCQFSADLASWFLQTFPDQVSPDETRADAEYMAILMQSVLPGIEFHDSTQGNHALWGRVRLLSGHDRNARGLKWLLDLFSQQTWKPVLSDLLYDQLKVFIRWDVGDSVYARSNLQLPFSPLCVRKAGKKKANSMEIINQPIGRPVRLSDEQRNGLITVARVSLACYFRETDPVTYADPAETFLYDMGGGLQIALLGMKRERVLALESYIGFMAFMNGIPVSYGGGWIFGYRCKIGVNIYPPFRGAGSDQLFCQVMRLYYQVYRVKRFVVKPYQFGKGNPEGLSSGAFWFYYRLGFRPSREDIRRLSIQEWEKILSDKKYRTPRPILRQFTVCHMEWEPIPTHLHLTEADKVSMAVTHMIRDRFNADRSQALQTTRKSFHRFLNGPQNKLIGQIPERVMDNWSLIFALVSEKVHWSGIDKQKIGEIIQARSHGPEVRYIRLLQGFRKFWKALDGV